MGSQGLGFRNALFLGNLGNARHVGSPVDDRVGSVDTDVQVVPHFTRVAGSRVEGPVVGIDELVAAIRSVGSNVRTKNGEVVTTFGTIPFAERGIRGIDAIVETCGSIEVVAADIGDDGLVEYTFAARLTCQ